jgi:citrate synthase
MLDARTPTRLAVRALMSAREAATLLEIKPATLYAYVSRGLLTSVPGTHGPSRLYARSDVERLKARHVARAGHGAVAAGALRFGEPVLESALTALDERGPRYRGHVAVELAERGASFESVVELLWGGDFSPELRRFERDESRAGARATRMLAQRLAQAARLVPPGAPPLSVLPLVVAALSLTDPLRFDAPRAAERTRARRLLHTLAAGVALGFEPRRVTPALHAPTVAGALALALGTRDTRRVRLALDRALVVTADHELNPSSFAARVAASTGADLYACLGAALGALSGPEHGGSCERIEALVVETARPDRAARVIAERLRRGDALPGFGHPLYPRGDPRATLLLSVTRPRRRSELTLAALVKRMRSARREPPNVDLALVATALELRLPAGSASALFAVARAAGWLAHVFEQREAGWVMRPRARYIGE